MKVQRELSLAFLETHVDEAAIALEGQSPHAAAAVLAAVPDPVAAQVLSVGSPHFAVAVCTEMSHERRQGFLEALPLDVAAGFLRRMSPELRSASLAAVAEPRAADLRSLLRFPAGSAGALMDPHALALSKDLTLADALGAIRAGTANVLYNLYVVDAAHLLVGVANLQELLAADPGLLLGAIMKKPEYRLRATLPSQAVLFHPGWRRVYSLPVVDEGDRFVGAVRYGTLRRLEAELAEEEGTGGSPAARALGELFSTGLLGLLEAAGATVAPPSTPGIPRDR